MKNKRSLFIVIAMVLLLAVVLGMGGTTFAKYITTKDFATETATVAKWGYVITANANELFDKTYANGVGTDVNDNAPNNASVDVWGSTEKVAPGTSGSFEFSITGTAEVDAAVSITVNDSETVVLNGYTDASNTYEDLDYEPIKWSVTKNTTPVVGVQDVSLEELVTYLEGQDFIYGTNAAVADTYEISWAWAFDDTSSNPSANLYDTVLGDAAAGTSTHYSAIDATLTVGLDLTISVEQIQQSYTGNDASDVAPTVAP